MLPSTQIDSTVDAAERQANFLILRTLESKLPAALFHQIQKEICSQMNLPARTAWDGTVAEQDYDHLKTTQSAVDSSTLIRVLKSMNFAQNLGSTSDGSLELEKTISRFLKKSFCPEASEKSNIYAQLRSKVGPISQRPRKAINLNAIGKFERMKTVFCHVDHTTDEVSSVFNVKFDQTSSFVISGADDGIIKVWDRETLILQASLHGHMDYITEIDVSKCNQFMASVGNDANLILWDLRRGKVVRKLTDHTALINKVVFFTPKKETDNPMNGGGSPSSTGQATREKAIKTKVPAYTAATCSAAELAVGQKVWPEKEQFLLTCSDDGTVVLYDLSPLSRAAEIPREQAFEPEIQPGMQGNSVDTFARKTEQARRDEFQIRKSSRQQRTNQGAMTQRESEERKYQTGETIFSLKLVPNDFRPGQKSKKLDALAVSQNGIVVAGSNTGEVFVWKVYFSDLSKPQKQAWECSKFVGQFKIHKNTGVQYCEISPTSEFLMTGSTNGIVNIWRIGDVPNQRKADYNVLKDFNLEDMSRLEVLIDEKNGCQRVKTLAFKDEDGNDRKEFSLEAEPNRVKYPRLANLQLKNTCDAIKWSVNGRFAIASITQNSLHKENHRSHSNGYQQKNELCKIKVWDTVEQTFCEDLARLGGIIFKKNTWVLCPHPIHEEILLTGSDGGQLIIWNLLTKQCLSRFSQYGVYSINAYVMDNPLDGKFSADGRAFIVGNQLGTISLFSNENKAQQYKSTRVQQFFPYDTARQNQNPFERITVRPQICDYNFNPYEYQPPTSVIGRFATKPEEEEEKDSSVQRGQLSDEFHLRLNIAQEIGAMQEQVYRDQIEAREQLLDGGESTRLERLEESSIERVNLDSRSQAVPSSDLNYLMSELSPERPRPQNVPQRSARQPATSSRQQRTTRQTGNAIRDQPEVNAMYGSELDSSPDRNQRQQRGRPNRDSAEEESEFISAESSQSEQEEQSEEENNDQQRRFFRRQATGDALMNSFVNSEPGNRSRYERNERRTRRTRQPEQEGRGEQRRLTRNSRPNHNAVESRGREERPIRRLIRGNRSVSESEEESKHTPARTARTTRSNPQHTSTAPQRANRGRRVLNDSMNGSQDNDQPATSAFEVNRQLNCEFLEDSESVQTENLEEVETRYEYFHNKADIEKFARKDFWSEVLTCGFCKREDEPLIGPFCKFENNRKLVGDPLYFHTDCIEKNKISSFHKATSTWVNIDTALTKLVHQSSSSCSRCNKPGATISCFTCKKHFHGFLCADLNLIHIESTKKEEVYQCLNCRNVQNFRAFEQDKDLLPSPHRYQRSLRDLSRDYFLRCKALEPTEFNKDDLSLFVPQIDDYVYYFFQGHEDYVAKYSCHFYCGNELSINEKKRKLSQAVPKIRDMPFVLCKVRKVSVKFPSERQVQLIDEFGKTEDFEYQPQLFLRVQLEVAEKGINQDFEVDLFPHVLPEFLVLAPLLAKKIAAFQKLQEGGSEGKVVKIATKQHGVEQVQIVSAFSPIEPTLYPKSMWMTVVCISQATGARTVHAMPSHRSRRVESMDVDSGNTKRINFWDIIFENESKFEDICGCDIGQRTNMETTFETVMQKKREYLLYFLDRVGTEYQDYRHIVAGEMYLSLIKDRLKNRYYRSQAQLFSDLKQIVVNAEDYNGKDHHVAEQAEAAIMFFANKLKEFTGETNDDQKLNTFRKMAGKLTVPTRLPTAAQQQEAYALMRSNGRPKLEETKEIPVDLNLGFRTFSQEQGTINVDAEEQIIDTRSKRNNFVKAQSREPEDNRVKIKVPENGVPEQSLGRKRTRNALDSSHNKELETIENNAQKEETQLSSSLTSERQLRKRAKGNPA